MFDKTLDASPQSHSLYDTDFVAWAEQTAQLLREQRFGELDLENLIEEIEALSRSDKREIRSRLIVLLSHLLKQVYQSEKRSSSWTSTISEQRQQISLILEDSPSLNRYLTEVLDSCYAKSRLRAAEETELPIATFPERCLFDPDQILEIGWMP